MNDTDVLSAAEECRQFLRGSLDADWTLPIPDMEWTAAQAIAHGAEGPLWYALDLSNAGPEFGVAELRFKPESDPTDLIDAIGTTSRILAAVRRAAPPETRGFHPFGPSDPAGYAAMACAELLIHTDDAARAFGRPFRPDPALCARVLTRLFRDIPPDLDPWDALRWAHGRIELPHMPRRQSWRWYPTPSDDSAG